MTGEDMSEKKYWDWSKYQGDGYYIPAKEVFYLLPRWAMFPGKRLLDLGCGMGRHSFLFAENEYEVYAFDNSEICLNYIIDKQKGKKHSVRTVLGDMHEKLPFEDNFFDCLIAYNVISHGNSQEIKRIINEIYRVMKPGGEIFLNFCSKQSKYFTTDYIKRIDENTIIKNVMGPEEGIPHYYVDGDSLKQLLYQFEIIDMFHVDGYVDGGKTQGDNKHYFVLCKKGQ